MSINKLCDKLIDLAGTKRRIMNKLLEQLEDKIRLAKYYRGICNNEITEDYIKEAQQIFKQIIGELKQ